MKKLIMIICSMSLFTATHAQTNVGGVLSGNVTWTAAGNPYTITANTLVQFTGTLTIQPGVIIYVNQGLYLQVDGTLLVLGSPSAPVTIQNSATASDWGGIRFTDISANYDSASGTGCFISNAEISGTGHNVDAIRTDSCAIRAHKCTISNARMGIDGYDSHSMIDSCTISDCVWGIGCEDANGPGSNAPYNIVRGNDIHDCGTGITVMRGIVEGNHVYNVVDGAYVCTDWWLQRPPVFINNIIENCTGVGLYLTEMCESGIFRGNVFRNNTEHLRISCDPKCEITCNRFMATIGQYKVFGPPTTWSGSCPAPGSGSYYIIDLGSNNWDGSSLTAMDTLTHDFYDDFSVGLVFTYSPMLSDSDSCLSPIPPVIVPPPPNGLHAENQAAHYSIYPNPASQSLSIAGEKWNCNELQIEIFAVDGKRMYAYRQEDVHGEMTQVIDISSFATGAYVVIVTTDGNSTAKRFVKLE